MVSSILGLCPILGGGHYDHLVAEASNHSKGQSTAQAGFMLRGALTQVFPFPVGSTYSLTLQFPCVSLCKGTTNNYLYFSVDMRQVSLSWGNLQVSSITMKRKALHQPIDEVGGVWGG